jgi:hypothetical protein
MRSIYSFYTSFSCFEIHDLKYKQTVITITHGHAVESSRYSNSNGVVMIYHLYSPLQGQAMERFYCHRLLLYFLQSNHSP